MQHILEVGDYVTIPTIKKRGLIIGMQRRGFLIELSNGEIIICKTNKLKKHENSNSNNKAPV